MTPFQQKRADKVKKYISDFPDEMNAPLARAIYKNNKKMFENVEQVRYFVRYYRGAAGEKNKKSVTDKAHIRPKGFKKPNPFNIPESSQEEKKVYKLPIACNKILLISDLHIPYHDIDAITAALGHGKKEKVNTIIINGDLVDFARISRFEPDPTARDTKHELDTTRAFLISLRKAFPTQKIIWIKGNHDERLEKYLFSKCVELFGDPYFHLEERLQLASLNIELIDGYTVVRAGKLNILHGDKLIRGVFAPVNAARGVFIRAKANTIIAHVHTVSEHSEGDLNGGRVGCWSMGCLCQLNPRYDHLNTKHIHGFAIVLTEPNGNFQVRNYKIIDGEIM